MRYMNFFTPKFSRSTVCTHIQMCIHKHTHVRTSEFVLQMRRTVESPQQSDAGHRGIYYECPSGICYSIEDKV